jgi:DNA invertase Pin-like site-specific DNA recombinase
MTRVIAYARFSPRPDAAESTANEAQLDQCRFFAKRSGWELVAHFQDDDKSGDDLDRPGLWAAIAELKKGNILLVWKLDRLARSIYLALTIENQVTAKGARIVSVMGEGTGSCSPEDTLIRNILHALAEYQKAAMAAQTKARMKSHQANGRRMGRSDRIPYGWELDPNDPLRMIVEEAEQGIIAKIRTYHMAGIGPCEIAWQLNMDGILCRGHPWQHQLIGRILRR